MMTIAEIIECLASAPRRGPAKDDPEGIRYFYISDTLASKMIDALIKYQGVNLK